MRVHRAPAQVLTVLVATLQFTLLDKAHSLVDSVYKVSKFVQIYQDRNAVSKFRALCVQNVHSEHNPEVKLSPNLLIYLFFLGRPHKFSAIEFYHHYFCFHILTTYKRTGYKRNDKRSATKRVCLLHSSQTALLQWHITSDYLPWRHVCRILWWEISVGNG